MPAGDADDEQTKVLRAMPGYRPKENALEVNNNNNNERNNNNNNRGLPT